MLQNKQVASPMKKLQPINQGTKMKPMNRKDGNYLLVKLNAGDR